MSKDLNEPKKCINDKTTDEFIHRYIKQLPKNWRSDLDMYLAMKNAMLEALAYPNKYQELDEL